LGKRDSDRFGSSRDEKTTSTNVNQRYGGEQCSANAKASRDNSNEARKDAMFEDARAHVLGAACSKVMPECFVASCWVLGSGSMKMRDEPHHSDIAVIDGERMSLVDAEERSSRSLATSCRSRRPERSEFFPHIDAISYIRMSDADTRERKVALFCANCHVHIQEMAGEGASLWDWERPGQVLCVRTLA